MDAKSLLFVAITASCEVAALYSLKQYVKSKQQFYLYAGMTSYAACGYFISKSMLNQNLATCNSLWNSMSNLYGAAIGSYFGDTLSPKEKWGVIGATMSSYLLVDSK